MLNIKYKLFSTKSVLLMIILWVVMINRSVQMQTLPVLKDTPNIVIRRVTSSRLKVGFKVFLIIPFSVSFSGLKSVYIFNCPSGFNRLITAGIRYLVKQVLRIAISHHLRWQIAYVEISLNVNSTIMRDTYIIKIR